MRAPLLEPLIVASSLPFASGLARFTSCELPKEAGLFSPDISQTQSKLCCCCLALANSSFCRMSSSGVSFGWLVVDLLSVDALTEKCARFRVECEWTRQRFSEIVSRVARAPFPGKCTCQRSEVNCELDLQSSLPQILRWSLSWSALAHIAGPLRLLYHQRHSPTLLLACTAVSCSFE